jgi:hypothetical protein
MPLAPVLEARDLSFGPLAVTELRYDAENYGQSAPIPAQDAVLVSLQLRANLKHEVWEDGKQLPSLPTLAGMTSIFDLRRGVTARSLQPFHCLNFAIPLRSLHEAGEERSFDLALERGSRQNLRDPVYSSITCCSRHARTSRSASAARPSGVRRAAASQPGRSAALGS